MKLTLHPTAMFPLVTSWTCFRSLNIQYHPVGSREPTAIAQRAQGLASGLNTTRLGRFILSVPFPGPTIVLVSLTFRTRVCASVPQEAFQSSSIHDPLKPLKIQGKEHKSHCALHRSILTCPSLQRKTQHLPSCLLFASLWNHEFGHTGLGWQMLEDKG